MRTRAGVVASLALLLAACAGATRSSPLELSSFPHSAIDAAAAATTYADWPQYHGGNSRQGNATTMPAVNGSPTVARKLVLDGAVYGSPLVVGGKVIVATENDSVYVFSSAYTLLYRRHLGTPEPQSMLPCGDIDPLGITGTPAYDPTTGLFYVAPEFQAATPTHQLYGIRLSDGTTVFHHSLDLPGVQQDAMQQRGALLLENNRVYVPFGGLAGDCGGYKGRVIGYNADGTGSPVSYTVPTTREAGIWTTPGPSADAYGNIYVAVGNGAAVTGDPYDHSDSILRLSTTLALQSFFAPTTWATDNANDADLGSQGPAIVGPWIFADGKSGTAYVLRRGVLGGIGGQVSSASICTSFGGTAVSGNVVYVPCTDGVRAVQISSTGAMRVLWHASASIDGSPVLGGGRVWSLNQGAGVLYELNPSNGAVTAQVSVGVTTRFASEAIYGPYVFVPTFTGVTVVKTS
jgi:hypothetical protein